jgi:hypothetical protein
VKRRFSRRSSIAPRSFLTQAGVYHDFIRLADHEIRGNAHMMMLEKNSDRIAAFIVAWLRSKNV